MTHYIKSTFAPFGTPPMIEIIAVPDGEAPEWVRREWIGLRLPLSFDGIQDCQVTGVVTGPRTWLAQVLHGLFRRSKMQSGYVVFGSVAVDLLADKSPKAAAWWRDVTPYVIDANYTLLFESHVCRLLPTTPALNPANT